MPKVFLLSLLFLLSCVEPRAETPQQRFSAAVLSLHRAAVPLAQQMAADATAAARSTQQPAHQAFGADSWLLEAQKMKAAVAAYAAAVDAGDWSTRLLPQLREAVRSYERLRELGLPLPEVPQLVRDLLLPCEAV